MPAHGSPLLVVLSFHNLVETVASRGTKTCFWRSACRSWGAPKKLFWGLTSNLPESIIVDSAREYAQ